MHVPGVGDFIARSVTQLPDPCPLPEKEKKRLNEKDRLIYAPMADLGDIVYDKDAVYINMPSSVQGQDSNGRPEVKTSGGRG